MHSLFNIRLIMKKNLFLWLGVVCIYTSSVAQRSKVSYIADEYLSIKEKIQNDELESSTFQLNMGNHSWNSTLGYKRIETYHYKIFNDRKSVLKFLEVTVDSTSNQYYIEYLYDNEGNLIYCSEKQKRPRYHYQELKTYFKDDQLIQLSEDNVIIQSSTIFHSKKVKYLRESARYYWEKFQDYLNPKK